MKFKINGIENWQYIEPIPPVRGTGLPFNMEIEGKTIEIYDGYHTLDELYNHRYALFIALCKVCDNYITPLSSRIKCWKSKFHNDGSMFDGFFIMGMTITEFTGQPTQITYHLPLKYWGITHVMIYERAPEWDGHTSSDTIRNLLKL